LLAAAAHGREERPVRPYVCAVGPAHSLIGSGRKQVYNSEKLRRQAGRRCGSFAADNSYRHCTKLIERLNQHEIEKFQW